MAINMNALPTVKPAMGSIIPKGQYKATIVKATMKQPKDETKPEYYTAECDITDTVSGASMGKFWINLFESEASLPLFQLGRFIRALELPITGDFELRDLTKITVGKSLLIDICPEERKDNQPPQRSQIDISADCFYPINDNKGIATAPTPEEIADVLGGPQANEAPTLSSSY